MSSFLPSMILAEFDKFYLSNNLLVLLQSRNKDTGSEYQEVGITENCPNVQMRNARVG